MVLTEIMWLYGSCMHEMKQEFGKLLLHSAHWRWIYAN
jgi:hypothetical protein